MSVNINKEHEVESVVNEVIEQETETLFLANPTQELLKEVILQGSESNIKVLADKDVVRRTFDDFVAASRAAMHDREYNFEIRTTDELYASPIIFTDNVTLTFTIISGETFESTIDNEEVEEKVRSNIMELYENSDEYEITTPPYDEVIESLEELNEEIHEDFLHVLDEFENISISRTGIDVVEVLLLLCARREQLLHELSTWGDDVGLASKATFSRAKSRLEERELVTAVKVPVTVGRPRLRLKLNPELLDRDPVDVIREATIRFEGRRQQLQF